MKKYGMILAVAMVAISVAAPVVAQEGGNGAYTYMTTDHNMRSSKLMGATVWNDAGDKIGTIEEILLPAAGGEVTVVLSVGGFLGVGQKMVKVPLSHVRLTGGKPIMPNAGKPALMAMPSYSYNYLGGNG